MTSPTVPGDPRLLVSGVDADPRETMRRVPRPLQLPLTMLTGKAHHGQRGLRLSPTFHLVTATTHVVTGVAVSALAVGLGGAWWAALLVGWALTLHGMRNLRMMIFHQCAHRNMWKKRRTDAFLGKFCAAVLVVQNFERYSAEHVGDHHAVHHMTVKDPTVQAFLVSLRLEAGMPTPAMWRRLLGRLFSPLFHTRFAVARVRSFAHGADAVEKALAIALYGSFVAAAAVTGGWLTLLLAWFVPLVPLFQISNTLRLCVKHTFPGRGDERRTGRDYFGSLTNAIFLGESAPESGRGPLAWLRWTARMVLVHFPARYLVMTGDTVVHDFHHRKPRTAQWPDYVFARQRDVEAGHTGWPAYREVWGLVAAIDVVFRSLRDAEPDLYSAARLAELSDRDLFAAFDD